MHINSKSVSYIKMGVCVLKMGVCTKNTCISYGDIHVFAMEYNVHYNLDSLRMHQCMLVEWLLMATVIG